MLRKLINSLESDISTLKLAVCTMRIESGETIIKSPTGDIESENR